MSDQRPPILGMMWPDRCDKEKRWLRRNSEVFRYAMEGTEASDGMLLEFVSEQCVASARLMQIAVSQYESVASGMQGSTFERRTLPAWMFISCAFSSVDACVAAIAAIVTGVVPKPENIAGMNSFATRLMKLKQTGHEDILTRVEDLRSSSWYAALSQVRHKIIHRGFWPINDWIVTGDSWHLVHSPFFLQLPPDGKRRGSSLPALSRSEILDLRQIAEGFLWSLEEWDASIVEILARNSFIKSKWRGPVRQAILLDHYDSSLPEACFLAEEDDFSGC